MSNAPFDESDFENLLDSQGADPARWPAAERTRANALLQASPQAQALLAEAQRLGETLDQAFPPMPAPAALESRILAGISRPSAEAVEGAADQGEGWAEWLAAWLMARLWRPVGIACAPFLIGFAMGMGFVEDTFDLDEQMLIAFSEAGVASMELGDAP